MSIYNMQDALKLTMIVSKSKRARNLGPIQKLLAQG